MFGKVLIIKSLGLSQLVYSASNLNVPIDLINDTWKKFFLPSFGRTKRTKSKESVYNYYEYERGGIRMPNLDLMLEALRLVWLPRLLNPAKQNRKSIPDHFFSKTGRSQLFVKMQPRPKVSRPKTTYFYRDIPSFFVQITRPRK